MGEEVIGHHYLATQVMHRYFFAQLVLQGNIAHLVPNGIGYSFAVLYCIYYFIGIIMRRHMNGVAAYPFYYEIAYYW